ncbi:GntR family transcriptional regulator [Variovorax sp. J22G21]|uniref:GntR family transcriptional regulator n=1 Tax=Variovorax fucosicus TaxID=3053517 RepID=UPI0025763AB5|nr:MULTISPECIES: GntR family transcriptional regulator [unclassified Variovorax]MDM0037689.1 GntR family transcriptional regulator [Variovorax sp. J22R193]MDM0062465.1 GntR family transcriptional regulator [Variovorax sp. J22G21]
MSSARALEPIAFSPVPLYTQVRETLRERILDGTYAPHAQLPSESEMVALFKVSRITVRQALSDLQRENLIFKIPGKGTFVAKPKAFQQLSQLEGFAEAMVRMGYEIRNQVTSHKTVPASPRVAQHLGLAEGTPVAQIKRVRHLNRAPVSYEVTYLPHAIGERLRRADLAGRDIFLILENDYGLALGHADLQIDAMLADEVLARALDVDEGTAVLRIERLTHTADGAPLDFEDLYFRGDAFQHRLRIARTAPAPDRRNTPKAKP